MGLSAQHSLTIGIVGVGLSLVVGCLNRPRSHDVMITVPNNTSVGSIAAREEVLRGWMAVHNHQWTAAQKHFHRAIQLDPHPSVQQLPSMVEKATIKQERGAQK